MLLRLLTAFLLAGSLCCSLPLAAQPQKFLTVYIDNRHRDGGNYYADVWITVRPGSEWRVSDVAVWARFNINALSPSSFIGRPVLNLDAELVANGYASVQNYFPNSPSVSIDVISPSNYDSCAVKGGPDGETFRLGTLCWTIGDYSAMDYVRFAHQFPVHMFAHRKPDNKDDIITDINWTTSDYSENTWQNLYITPSGCGNMFYEQPQSCGENLRSVSTLTPLTRVSPHWPPQPGPGIQPHIAYYQYDMLPINLPTSAHSRNFNPGLLTTLLDRARCRWEAQVDHLLPPATNYFEWQETSEGGRMYFTTEPENISQDFIGAAFSTAVTNMARDENAYSFFVDTSACGGQIYPVAFQRRSEVVFNNSSALYAANPHFKWTTDFGGCGGGPDCNDFYSIALHELGHYVGLAHEERNHTVVMTNADVSPFPMEISQCDADNIRRLYNPVAIGDPPDNSFNCGLITTVQATLPAVGVPTLEVYPLPGVGSECTVVYSLPQRDNIIITLADVLGNSIDTIVSGRVEAGHYEVRFSSERLATGTYFVVMQAAGSVVVSRMIVAR